LNYKIYTKLLKKLFLLYIYGKLGINYKIKSNEKIILFQEKKSVPVQIPIAIASYARIITQTIKNKNLKNLYYSDTDSFFINKPFNTFNINTNIGNLKKMYKTCDYALFFGNKFYCVTKKKERNLLINIKCRGASFKKINFFNFYNLIFNKEIFYIPFEEKFSSNFNTKKKIYYYKNLK